MTKYGVGRLQKNLAKVSKMGVNKREFEPLSPIILINAPHFQVERSISVPEYTAEKGALQR